MANTTNVATKEVTAKSINKMDLYNMINSLANSVNVLANKMETLESVIRVSKDNNESPFYASKEELEAKKASVNVSASKEEKKAVSSEVSANKATASVNASMNDEAHEKAVINHNNKVMANNASIVFYHKNDGGYIFKSRKFKVNGKTVNPAKSLANSVRKNLGGTAVYTMDTSEDNGKTVFTLNSAFKDYPFAEYSYYMTAKQFEQYAITEEYKLYSDKYFFTDDETVYVNALDTAKQTKEKLVVKL